MSHTTVTTTRCGK